jgi:LacI family transcriptional regulator
MTKASRFRERSKATISDVARLAGVSIGTVSNVLNPRIPVSDARRAAVVAAIDSLGFLPNRVAQSLRRRHSRVVGLIAHDTASAYFAALLDNFERIGAQQGYEVMQVLSRGDPQTEVQRARALLERQVDGILLVPTAAPGAAFDQIAAAGVPAVVIDRVSDDPRFDYVSMDNSGVMADAVAALAAAGRKRLTFVVRWPELITTQHRMAAFAATGKKIGIHTETFVRAADDGEFGAQIEAMLRRREHPDAIIASNSILALPLIAAIERSKVRIPDDISLLVFDEPNWALIVDPPLSIVRHPIKDMARSAWNALIERIDGYSGPSRRIVHPAELVIRASI